MTPTRSGIASALLGVGALCCQPEVTVDLLGARVAEPNPVPALTSQPEPDGDAPESDAPDAGPENPVDVPNAASPIHHYDFEGEGTVVYDRVGDADGELLGGAVLDGAGSAVLDGVDDYVELPPGLISDLSAATLVAWLEWAGGDCWQRIFDFGNTVDGEEGVTHAGTSVFLTPATCPWAHFGTVQDALVSAEFHVDDSVYFAQGEAFPTAAPTFAALVVDPARGLEIVVNGVVVGSSPAPLNLAEIEDVNAWLGRSQWSVDAQLMGRYDEFMIFDVALTAAELQALYVATDPRGDATAPADE